MTDYWISNEDLEEHYDGEIKPDDDKIHNFTCLVKKSDYDELLVKFERLCVILDEKVINFLNSQKSKMEHTIIVQK